jgi:hypothetical protein
MPVVLIDNRDLQFVGKPVAKPVGGQRSSGPAT